MQSTGSSAARILAIALLVGMAGQASAFPNEHLWSFGWEATGRAATDANGRVFAAGTFAEPIDFGGGEFVPVNFFNGDVFLAAFEADGTHRWSRAIPHTGLFGATVDGLVIGDDGNLYLTGIIKDASLDFGGGALSGPDELFLAALDADGNHLWSLTCGDAEPTGLAVKGQRIAVTGFTEASADFGGGTLATAGLADAVTAVFDTDGNHIWSDIWGDDRVQAGSSVALDPAGEVVMAATTWGTTDFGGGPLIAVDLDLSLVRFDAAGAHLWSRIFHSEFSNSALAVTDLALRGDRIALAGTLVGPASFCADGDGGDALGDAMLALFDDAGDCLWVRAWGDGSTQSCNSVDFDAAGDLLIGGSFGGELSFGPGTTFVANAFFLDLFVVGIDDEDGGFMWGQSFSGTNGHSNACRISAIADGDILVHGWAADGIDFGGGLLAQANFFIAKLGEAETAASELPLASALRPAFPNPFNPRSTLSFALSEAGPARLSIHDARGRRLRVLVDSVLRSGEHRVDWNGRDQAGRPLAAGVYLARLESSQGRESQRLVLLK